MYSKRQKGFAKLPKCRNSHKFSVECQSLQIQIDQFESIFGSDTIDAGCGTGKERWKKKKKTRNRSGLTPKVERLPSPEIMQKHPKKILH